MASVRRGFTHGWWDETNDNESVYRDGVQTCHNVHGIGLHICGRTQRMYAPRRDNRRRYGAYGWTYRNGYDYTVRHRGVGQRPCVASCGCTQCTTVTSRSVGNWNWHNHVDGCTLCASVNQSNKWGFNNNDDDNNPDVGTCGCTVSTVQCGSMHQWVMRTMCVCADDSGHTTMIITVYGECADTMDALTEASGALTMIDMGIPIVDDHGVTVDRDDVIANILRLADELAGYETYRNGYIVVDATYAPTVTTPTFGGV